MKLVKFGPPPWRNQDLTLFHGTLASHVVSIRAGIDSDEMDSDADFGKGFYTTTNWVQARRFAYYVAARELETPAVLEYSVRRDDLAKLEFLAFVIANRHSDDYWSVIESCRAYGQSNRALERWYDFVVGPVAKDHQKRRAWREYDQLSFHTERAYRLLDKRLVRVHTW